MQYTDEEARRDWVAELIIVVLAIVVAVITIWALFAIKKYFIDQLTINEHYSPCPPDKIVIGELFIHCFR